MPIDWIIKEKTLASADGIPSTFVKTGNATAPPPSDVAPAIKEPKIIVSVTRHCAKTEGQSLSAMTPIIQATKTIKIAIGYPQDLM
jgi:hypothetical protein